MSGEGGAPTELPPSYPNYADKHRARPIVTPADMLAWRRDQQRARAVEAPEEPEPPRAAVLTYQPSLLRALLDTEACTRWPGAGALGQVHLLERTGGRVAVVGGFGFGAPVAAIVMENLVALGVERFVSMGTAGGLQPGQAFGDVVVCTAAVRDEGVSHHYVPPARWAHPDARADGAVGRRADRGRRGGHRPGRRGRSTRPTWRPTPRCATTGTSA